MSTYEWSTTAADNATADANIGWAESQAPSTVNNSARAEMAAMASFFEAIGGALTTGGTGSAYTLTLSDAPTAYTTSMLFLVKFNVVSASTTATINVNSLGAKTLKTWDGSALPSSTHIPVNAYGFVKYDGTNFRVFIPANYETGSFTPTLFGNTSAGTTTYTTQTGSYTRSDSLVTAWGQVIWTAASGTGGARIGGLPFTCASGTDNRGLFYPHYYHSLSLPSGSTLGGYVDPGGDYVILLQRTNTSSSGTVDLQSELTPAGELYFWVIYEPA